MVAILNQKWPPKYKIQRFGRNLFSNMIVKNWALIISCYVLTLFFIHTTSTCIVHLGDICNAPRYSNQYFY
jgi:mannitol-specific phosphotransferase system IIBC component